MLWEKQPCLGRAKEGSLEGMIPKGSFEEEEIRQRNRRRSVLGRGPTWKGTETNNELLGVSWN